MTDTTITTETPSYESGARFYVLPNPRASRAFDDGIKQFAGKVVQVCAGPDSDGDVCVKAGEDGAHRYVLPEFLAPVYDKGTRVLILPGAARADGRGRVMSHVGEVATIANDEVDSDGDVDITLADGDYTYVSPRYIARVVGEDSAEVETVDEAGAESEPVDEADPVNRPSHYTRLGAEVIDITEHLPFNRGNAVKYLARAGAKEGADELEDLRKAAWYANREVARIERQRAARAS